MRKINFDDRQRWFWSKMLEAIEEYRDGKIRYSEMASNLEKALDTGDFQDKALESDWYKFWTPLEIARLKEDNNADDLEIDQYISEMKKYLEDMF